MRCALGQEWDGTSCIGTASRHTWNEAMACGHTFAGHNNWRVPNIEELQGLSILSRDSLNTYLSFFPKAPTSDYWSSTIGRKDLDSVKYLALPSGNVCISHKNASRHLRLVRDTNAIVEGAIMKSELGKSIEIARMAANLAKPVTFRETTASGAGYPEYTNNSQNNVSVSDRAQTRNGMVNNKVALNTVADKHVMLIKASKHGMKRVLIRLLNNGANINHMDALGLAPLDYAIMHGDPDWVAFLKAKGAVSARLTSTNQDQNLPQSSPEISESSKSVALQSSIYLDNNDGTVTDKRTGLTWMRCALGQIWDGTTCTGEAGVYGWKFANCINQSHTGYEDWRLPTKYELKGIVDSTRKDPSIDIDAFPGTPCAYFWSSTIAPRPDQAWGVDFSHGVSAIGSHGFANHVRFVRNWNLTKSVSEADEIAAPLAKETGRHLDNGDSTINGKVLGSQISNEGYTVYTRDNNKQDEADACSLQAISDYNKATDNTTKRENSYYIDNSDGTITDTRTGLMWMRCALGQAWDGAACTGEVSRHRLDYALNISMTFSTYSDWRLPTIEELESLTDPIHTNPIIDVHAFPNTPSSYPNKWFWSSSPNAEAPTYALRMSFGNGEVFSFASRTECWSVRLVRTCTEWNINNRIVGQEKSVVLDQPKEIFATNEAGQCCADPDYVKTLLNRIDIMENLLRSSIERIEMEVRLASSSQLTAIDRLESVIKNLLVSQVVSKSHNNSDANIFIDNADTNRVATRVVNIETLLIQLVELKAVSQTELRALLFPIGLMPNAVINDINERALDLAGELALVEDGDNIVVRREILRQILAAWSEI